MGQEKFYAVWKGRQTGIFSTWEECKQQVHGYPGARYESFKTRLEAKRALEREAKRPSGKADSTPPGLQLMPVRPARPVTEGHAVDAACAHNPGRVEWRGVRLADGQEVFHAGPFANGTNNIGEFLAIVQALQLLARQGDPGAVYSDSATAILWVRRGKCNTRLTQGRDNAPLFALLEEAEAWLAEHPRHNPVLKWNTHRWGEIPADFNRKRK